MAVRRKFGGSWFAALALWLPGVASAIDFASIAEPAVLYGGPSTKDKPLFVISRDTPVEMLLTLGAMVKIRDADGTLAWVEKSSLATRRTVIVRAERGQVREAAQDSAPLVFEAEKQVVLDLVEAGPPGWASVKHRGGQGGYVKASQVWGL